MYLKRKTFLRTCKREKEESEENESNERNSERFDYQRVEIEISRQSDDDASENQGGRTAPTARGSTRERFLAKASNTRNVRRINAPTIGQAR